MIHRRSFLRGLVGLIAAPAIVTATNIMPVRALAPESVYSPKRWKNYTGHAMRLRGSDNVEYDIGFMPDGAINIDAINRMCGGIRRLVTWYDQSGNGQHMTGAVTFDLRS